MEQEVIISIKGIQNYVHAQPDQVELVTKGWLIRDEEGYLLSYQESEVTGLEGTLTTFQVEPERVTLVYVRDALRLHVHRGQHPPPAGRAGRERRGDRDRLRH